MSVATLEQEFKKFIEPLSMTFFKYSMHSMRSGAASNSACRRMPGDLLDMHAGWRYPSSKNIYIKHTVKDRLRRFCFKLATPFAIIVYFLF